MFSTYILESQNTKKYYIGSTNDIQDRLNRHNSEKVVWTKRYRPWNLIYTENYQTLSEARKREKQLKSWHKRKSIENLIKNAAIV